MGPDCAVPGHDGIFAIGDVAEMTGSDGKALPGLAPVAKQRYLARVIRDRIDGLSAAKPFRCRDFRQLAVLGRSFAVADFG